MKRGFLNYDVLAERRVWISPLTDTSEHLTLQAGRQHLTVETQCESNGFWGSVRVASLSVCVLLSLARAR